MLRVALRGALRLCALLVVVAAAWLGYGALTTSRASLSQLSAFSPGQVAAPKAAASTPALVIHAPTPTASPAGAAAPAPYVVGAWVSNMSPPASGAVSLYVRVSNMQTDSPEARIPVSAEVQFTCADPQVTTQVGPIVTDGDGIARLSVPYSNLPVGIPVCITAVATIDGQVYTANTTFAAR